MVWIALECLLSDKCRTNASRSSAANSSLLPQDLSMKQAQVEIWLIWLDDWNAWNCFCLPHHADGLCPSATLIYPRRTPDTDDGRNV